MRPNPDYFVAFFDAARFDAGRLFVAFCWLIVLLSTESSPTMKIEPNAPSR